ncbi:MAG: hypothetical protein MI700_10215 [Balneolales bacterium]|nr:hypothetical protein [Balneolales bacterium]
MKQLLRFNSALVLLMAVSTLITAQQLDMELLKGIEPRNIGPAGMSGRITAIDVVESNPDIMYVGSASGGIWKSESGGIKWEPIFDDYSAASIGAIDIHQKSPDIIWVGTGEGNPRNSANAGAGVYRSLDGGRTFELMGLEGTRNIHRVIIHPDDPNTVYVGAQGDQWAASEHRGVYKTTDGGKTWNKILYNNDRTGIADMVMDPANPDKIFAAMWRFERSAWFFESGGEGSGMYMTLDGGETWNMLTSEDGLPEGPLGKMGIAIAPSNPSVVYALIESEENAIYRSDDGGFTWELRQTVEEDGNVGNRPFYYSEIYVDPFNENIVFSLYTYLSRSEDGGRSFESLYPYYNWVHPDHHAFWLSHDNPGFLIDGNDGGLNISFDNGDSWRFIENIPVGQYYHVEVDMEIPYNVYGGMQDNGSWQGPAYVWRSGGIRNSYWDELFFGDGFDVMIDPTNSRYAYAQSQQGNVARVDRETGSSRFVKPTHPEGEHLRFNWNAPINFDPFVESGIYFGTQYVHYSPDRGETWRIISPDLTTNDTTKQRQHESGGLTMDATGAENHTTLLAIEASPVEEGVIWAGSDDGLIHVTRDGGETWDNVSRFPRGVEEGSWVAQIKVSAFNAGEAFAVLNNYRRGDWRPIVLHTTDYGRRWVNLLEDKGVEGYALSFVQDLEEPGLMFAGTELGLYVTIDGGDTWTKWTNGYPTVSTYDMVIHPREHDLVIGTFGRSFWVFDDIRPLRELAANGINELEKPIKAFASPDAYLATWRQATGSRFSADGMFMGENRGRGAMLTYAVNKSLVEEDDEEEDVTIEIYDMEGNKLRTFDRTPQENGVNRTSWGLERAGVRNPSRNAPRGNNNFEPGGSSVLPGTYKVKYTYGDYSDSTMVTVHPDPRIEMPMAALEATYAFYDNVYELRSHLRKHVSMLHDAQTIIQVNETLVKNDPREEKKELMEMNKATKERIGEIMDMIFGKQDDRQGITRNPDVTVMQRLFAPNRYLGGDYDGPGATEENLFRIAEEAVEQAVQEINAFVEGDWAEYQSAMESANLSPFKDLTTSDTDN